MNLDGPKFKRWFAEYYSSGFHFGEDYEGIPREVEDEIGLSPQEAYDLAHPHKPKTESKNFDSYPLWSPRLYAKMLEKRLRTKI